MKSVADVKTRFVGYDSFAGFGKIEKEDKHFQARIVLDT
jgi:hypothetical protein